MAEEQGSACDINEGRRRFLVRTTTLVGAAGVVGAGLPAHPSR
jgi:ubiquinol-cytochrome c reductase iron-sulfur subunit